MSSEDSDTEMQSAVPKKTIKKLPKSAPAAMNVEKSEETKKLATKDMVLQALIDLKSRKGTSLQAIKKYIAEKYKVDVEKLNYIIKRYIKASVERGTIVQVKGVGASGSFKLVTEKMAKKPLKKKNKSKIKKTIEKPTSEKPEKTEKLKKSKSTETPDIQKPKKKVEKSEINMSQEKKEENKKDTSKPTKKAVEIKKQTTKKITEVTKTPAKKKSAMMKRKSIGTLIKPPKMNPKKG